MLPILKLVTRPMRAKSFYEQEYGNGKRDISEMVGGARVPLRQS